MSVYAEYWAQDQSRNRWIASQASLRLIGRLSFEQATAGLPRLRQVMFELIAAAHDDPQLYRATLGEARGASVKPEASVCLQDDNPIYALLAEAASSCVALGQLHGQVGTMTAVLWTATHGAAMTVSSYGEVPLDSWRRYASIVIEATLCGLSGLPA